MLVAQSWITELVQAANPQWSATADQLDAGFVSVGLEVEGEPVPLPQITGPLVVGRVESIEELTEFKKPIRFCQLEVGRDELQNIVCGASNFSEGDLVVVALPGCVLPGDFTIGSRKTYGKMSEGMICSVDELGVGKGGSSGILVLEPGMAKPGADAKELLGLEDVVIELNITPDRGYCFSMRGLTRELCCGFDLQFTEPVTESLPASSQPAWPVSCDEQANVHRFAVRKITGINPQASTPWWMKRRLLLAGVRPISPAVDITNYVMMELGHPMHAFDADKLSGDITVRRAASKEKLVTLDGQTRTLDSEDVVICDDSGPISLAGVMGGASTEVSEDTTSIVFEAAVWEPLSVFRTSRRHKLSSEASKRYERGVDAAISIAALDRACTLMQQIAGGSIEDSLTDLGSVDQSPQITITDGYPAQIAGVEYPAGTTARRLTQIGCEVSTQGDVHTVTPPSWRPDLAHKSDLVEEVLRLEGLESIPSVMPQAPAGRGLTDLQKQRRAVGRVLAASGYVEVLSNPFVSTEALDNLNIDDERRSTVSVINPLDNERADLAPTLLPSLCEIALRNISRGNRNVSLFSIAQVVLGGDNVQPVEYLDVTTRPTDEELERLHGSLPAQPKHVGMLMCGERESSGHWGAGRAVDAVDAFDAARVIAAQCGVDVSLEKAEKAPWHPGRCAAVTVISTGEVVGYAGELHPAVVEKVGLPARSCAVEINLDALGMHFKVTSPVIGHYPPVKQDIALVVDETVAAGDVADTILGCGEALLESCELFDVYTSEQLGENKKSLAFALTFRSLEKTLTEDDATEARNAAVKACELAHGAVLRG